MSKSFGRRPKRAQMHPKSTPESSQDQRGDQGNPEMSPRRGPGSPKAPQRPNKQFWLFESLLWEPSKDPLGKKRRRANSVI